MRSWRLAAWCLCGAAGLAQAAPIDELTTAAYRNDGRTVTLLMLRGVNPNDRDARGRSPLDVALREESAKSLQSLLEYPGLDVNTADENGETPLMLAAIKGRLDWVQTLVKKGARINKEGWTPLHYACSGPDKGVAAWLLTQGAEIDSRSPNGSTPMMLAARYGPYDLAEVLLKAGADASLRNEQGLTAADFAQAAERPDLAKKLRSALR